MADSVGTEEDLGALLDVVGTDFLGNGVVDALQRLDLDGAALDAGAGSITA